MKIPRIAFIGGGNMARSLVGGLLQDGCDPQRIVVADPDGERLGALAQGFPIGTTSDNVEAARAAEVVILAVKPQTLRAAVQEIAPVVQERRPLVISIAAGVRAGDIGRWLGGNVALVRCMPNTPALVLSGATGLYATPEVTEAQRAWAESIMRAVGVTLWVDDEAAMDAVTALSGSGPAYFFLVMEALAQAGQGLGLSHEAARLLTLQTALGAAKMALESADELATLRQRVTSPGGTTEQALEVLEKADLRGAFARALTAADRRASELAQLFGRD